jgi:hypothetical protein
MVMLQHMPPAAFLAARLLRSFFKLLDQPFFLIAIHTLMVILLLQARVLLVVFKQTYL